MTVYNAAARLWLLVAASLPQSAFAQQALDVTWLTFAQLTAERADGDSRVSFGTDRVRAKIEATTGRWTGGGVLDFGAGNLGDRPTGTLANVVADLYVNYRLAEHHLLRVGQFKTPLGMDFNMPGHELDLTKRGMEAGLVFNRDLGVMLGGQRAGTGIGYDIGLFNPAGRSGATRYDDSQLGDAAVAVARVRYDAAQWHTEASYGEGSAAGGPGTATYAATDLGFRYSGTNWNAKVEWLEGDGVRGNASHTERVYYVHGGYQWKPNIEFVARYYSGHSDLQGAATRLSNTFVGATLQLFDTARMNGRLQLNYVFAGEDRRAYSGVAGYRDDSVLVQFQIYAGP